MKRQEKHRLQLWILFSLVCSTPFFVWFDYYQNDRGRAIAALVAGTVFLIVVGQFWALKNTFVFWGIALVAALIQMLIVIAIPWPASTHPRGSGLMALGIPDLLIMYGLFKLAEKFAAKRSLQS